MYPKVKSWEKTEVKAIIEGSYPKKSVDADELADNLLATLNSSALSIGTDDPTLGGVTTPLYVKSDEPALYILVDGESSPQVWKKAALV